MDYKISVIVPVYNVEKYLEKCIESIINQTYKNLEIILVNDGSLDNSLKICNKYENIDSRIKVINKENGGLSDARNKGLEVATGDYISFIDSDDYIDKYFYEVLLKNAIEKNAEISQCNFKRVNENHVEKNIIQIKEIELYNNIHMIDNLYNNNKSENAVVVWNKIYKKNIFDDVRFYKGIIHEDEAIIHELFYNANRIVTTSEILYYYLDRPNSIINKSFSIKNLDYIKALELRIEFLNKKLLNNELFLKTHRQYCHALLKNYIKVIYYNLDNKDIVCINLEKKINENFNHFIHNKYIKNSIKISLLLYKINRKLFIKMMNKKMLLS